MIFKVTDLADENGGIPAPDRNPPLPHDLPTGPPLRKVVNSQPFPPKKDEEDDDKPLENRRALP